MSTATGPPAGAPTGSTVSPECPREGAAGAHEHGHGHGHDHDHAAETGSVLIDVGGGRGALVLYLDESFRGRELEISRVGVEFRVHTGVLERSTSRGTVLAAVFGSIAEGSYIVWRDATTPGGRVEVLDGQVTEVQGLGAPPQ